MTILDTLADEAKRRYAECDPASLKDQAMKAPPPAHSFRAAVAKPGLSFICEVKKASPSKGMIAESFPYLAIARAYRKGGADAISVLTEPSRFLGSDRYLEKIAKTVPLPILRKDFIIGEYQIYEAKLLGSSAILLICAILTPRQLKDYLALASSLGLDALVETHDEEEIEMALEAGSTIIGVNNRDLKTFEVDRGRSIRLRDRVPDTIPFVSESGIKTKADIAQLAAHRIDAVLIGETLMRSADPKTAIERLRP